MKFLTFSLLLALCAAVTNPTPISTGHESNCSRNSADWKEHYRLLESYVPRPGDPVKTVHCNILIWQNDKGTDNWQDTPAHRERLYNFFHHPTLGLNFQMYKRYNPPSDPVLPPGKEVHTKNIFFKLEGIYFFQDSALSKSMGMHDKRKYLRENGYGHLLHQLNINITTSPGPVKGAWGHANYPSYGEEIPMITTTDDPNQRGYNVTPGDSVEGLPISIASEDGKDFHRDWGFMEHLAHEIGHCIDLRHVYDGKVPGGYEACRTNALDYMADIFPPDAAWCETPREGCEVCLQISDDVPADRHPDDGRTNNLMNGKGGRYLSPGQLGKIHRAFATKSISRATSGFSEEPVEITRDETWDFSFQLYRPLLIRAGNTLTVKCTLHMPQKGSIIIEAGAKLIVDGGTVTRSNPNTGESWPGIKLTEPGSQKDFLELRNGGKLSYVK